MTVVKSSAVSKPKSKPQKKNLIKTKSDFVDVFSNSQLTCGISKDHAHQNESDSFDPMSEEEEESQAPK